MGKNKTLIKYSFFFAFGQYKAEKNVSAYVILLLFEAFVWGMISFFLYDQIMDGVLPVHSAFIIPMCCKCFFAIIEKYGELSIGYNLKNYFTIKVYDIIKLRLICKLISLSEYFYIATIIFFSVVLLPQELWFTTILITLVAYYLLYEVLAIISYQYNELENL